MKQEKSFTRSFILKFNLGHFNSSSFTPNSSAQLHLIQLEKIFPNNTFPKQRFKIEEKDLAKIPKILNFEKQPNRDNTLKHGLVPLLRW